MPSWLKSLLIVDDSALDNSFVLREADADDETDDTKTEVNRRSPEEREIMREPVFDVDPLEVRTPIRPIPMAELLHEFGAEVADGDTHHESSISTDQLLKERIPLDLKKTKSNVEQIFNLPTNKDVYIREFTVGTENPWPALAVFVDGMSDKTIINTHILQPLMFLSHVGEQDVTKRMKSIAEKLLPGNQAVLSQKWEEIVPGILAGSTAVFVDGCDSALIVETKGWEHRTVSTAQTEVVVRGPHEAFTENFRANTGLVRAQFRSERLTTEMLSVGNVARTDIAVMYVKDIANPQLVKEVKRRIKKVDVDYLSDSGILEQFLEDDPFTMVPQTMSTERPDRVAHSLSEGHVAIFVGNSPFALVVPVVLWSLVQTPEDAYLRFPFGSFLRALRWVSIVVALLLPAFYVAVTNYHPEMLPTDLMLAIAGSREQVPFPVVGEVVFMEFAIELIREAGIRIPSVIGPTIGIVGALIIGQSAVQAGIVSPLLVIVVAVTALASFTIPNYNLSMGVRLGRFFFLVASAFFGFYGIALMCCMWLAKLSVQKSFGVPFLAPVAPSMDASPDVLLRGPAYAMNQRPAHLKTQKPWRQDPITRPWSAVTRQAKRGKRKGDE